MRHYKTTFAATIYFLALQANALDLALSVGVEAENTDNTTRVAEDEIEEWIYKPLLDFSAAHEGPRLTLDAEYSFERRLHEDDIYRDENATTGRSSLLWNAVPERLDFAVTNTRTETPVQAIRSISPENVQETSVTTAGPTLRFQTIGADELQFSYAYRSESREATNNGSDAHTLTARYNFVLSPSNMVSLIASKGDTDFDAMMSPDLETTVAQVLWERESPRTNLVLSGGHNKTERDQGRDDVDGATYNASFDWRARPTTGIGLASSRSITAQSASLEAGTSAFGESFSSTSSDLNEVYTTQRHQASITQQLGPNILTLSAYKQDDEYEDILRDNDSEGLSFRFSRALGPRTNFALALTSRTQDFTDENNEVKELRGSTQLSWTSRRLSVEVEVSYRDRDAEVTTFGDDFDEWMGLIRLRYAILEDNSGA